MVRNTSSVSSCRLTMFSTLHRSLVSLVFVLLGLAVNLSQADEVYDGRIFLEAAKARVNKVDQQDPKSWIALTEEVTRKINFQGYFTYERGASSRSYQYIHVYNPQLEKTQHKLTFLDGDEKVFIFDAGKLFCTYPTEKKYHLLGMNDVGDLINIYKDFSKVWQLYDARLLEPGRVAGRPVQRVYLKPKDKHRHAYLFEIDQETAYTLQMLVLNESGEVVERFRYVAIDFTSPIPKSFVRDVDGMQLVEAGLHKSNVIEPMRVKQPADEITKVELQVGWMPDGFSLLRYQPSDNQDGHLQHVIYSDGLSSFSVFADLSANIDSAGKVGAQSILKPKRLASWVQGGVIAVSHLVEHDGHPYRVTVVGELPRKTLEKIVLALSLKAKS